MNKMGKEIIKNDSDNSLSLSPEAMEGFTTKLHQEPLKSLVKTNKFADNSRYLPISVVETTLDELFFGLWQVKDFTWNVVANEIVGALSLGVFHPIAKTWIWRTGAGAVLIKQKSESKGGTGDITDPGQKIKNALVTGFPHLKAQCLKNAAQSLGPLFGRDLNRDYWEGFTPFSEEVELTDHAAELLKTVTSEEELNQLIRQKPLWRNSTGVYNLVLEKRKSLKNGKSKK